MAFEVAISGANGTQSIANSVEVFNPSLTATHNGLTTFTFTLPSTNTLTNTLERGKHWVRVYRNEPAGRVLRFHGTIWGIEFEIGSDQPGGMITYTCVDQLAHLARRYTTTDFTSTDAGEIARQLVATTNSGNGISHILADSSNIETTVDRDRTYSQDRISVADAIISLTNVLDGFDFRLNPTEWTDQGSGTYTMSEFHVYAQYGSATSVCTFGMGEGTVNNCASITGAGSLDNITTSSTAVGASGQTTNVVDATLRNAIGTLETYTNLSSVIESATLTQHAYDRLTTSLPLVDTLEVEPLKNKLMLFDDFQPGDYVTIHARLGSPSAGLDLTQKSRVRQATIELDESGTEVLTEVIVEAPNNEYQE